MLEWLGCSFVVSTICNNIHGTRTTRQPRTPRHQQRPLGATTVLILGNSTPSFNMVSTTEIQARVLTGQLTKASADINQAAQNLEKTFQEMNRNATETG
jgi:hypothetical protein